jgi:uncharacterized protein (DUF2147 family)
MTRIALIASLTIILAMTGPSPAADISGVWLTNTGDAHIRMAKCGAAMCGNIVWMRDAKAGATATDVHNPDPSKRSRPLLGLMIALDFRQSAGDPDKFIGHFYNAEDGNTYSGSIGPAGPNALNVEGCLAIFCQSQIWTRVKR